MTVSRISLGFLAAALLALGAHAQTGEATAPPRSLNGAPPQAAQDQDQDEQTAPLDDSPSPKGDEAEKPPYVDTSDLKSDIPEPDQKAAPKQAPPADEAPFVPPPPKPAIEVQTLGTVEGPAEGLLDPSNGGFEASMWSASPRGDVETLLARAPLASPDSAVRTLAKRLILTRADAPAGTINRPLITIRIEKLLNAGLTDEAAALAASAAVRNDPDFARVQADAILSAGRANDACGGATEARTSLDDQFWLQLRAYCAAATKDDAAAEVTRNVLDAKQLTDNAYNILVKDALTGAKKPPGPIAKPTSMHLFLLRKAGLPIAADLAKKLGVGASLLEMRDARNKPEARLAAAERVVKSGAASLGELKAVLDAQAIASDRLAGAKDAAPKLQFLSAQALLRRAAQLETRPPVKAALVHQALLLGDKAGMFEIAAKLQADAAASIDAKAVPGDPLLGWSLLIAGKPDAAARWLGDNAAAHAVLALVSSKEDTAQAALAEIAKRLGADPKQPDPNEPFEALVLGSYDALGLTMPASAKTAAKTAAAGHWPGRRPDAGEMQKIMQAANAPERKGEAVLRILVAVGAAGPRDLAPDVTVEFVRVLKGMGLNDAARALAVHALLLYRPS